MEIEIFCEGKISLPFKGITRKKIKDCLQRTGKYLNFKNKAITVVLTDNKNICELNHKFRKKNRPTDVISFSYDDDFFPDGSRGKRHLGDLYISLEKALAQSGEYGATLLDETNRLLVHGVLHLAGFDHERSEKDEKIMRREEEKILNHFTYNIKALNTKVSKPVLSESRRKATKVTEN